MRWGDRQLWQQPGWWLALAIIAAFTLGLIALTVWAARQAIQQHRTTKGRIYE